MSSQSNIHLEISWVGCLVLLKFTAVESVIKHNGYSVFWKEQMPGIEICHLKQPFEIQCKGSQLLSLNKGNRREQTKSYLVFAFKSSHSWCRLSTQNTARLEILPSALFPLRKRLLHFTFPEKINIIMRKAFCYTGLQYTRRQNAPQVHVLDQICQCLDTYVFIASKRYPQQVIRELEQQHRRVVFLKGVGTTGFLAWEH